MAFDRLFEQTREALAVVRATGPPGRRAGTIPTCAAGARRLTARCGRRCCPTAGWNG
ncbi:MAG TPA: hypothetical protein VLJ59_10870 [Mycobacteriales bacterium]|nr:hypothetical protein [Mycobacteriales bacterium]